MEKRECGEEVRYVRGGSNIRCHEMKMSAHVRFRHTSLASILKFKIIGCFSLQYIYSARGLAVGTRSLLQMAVSTSIPTSVSTLTCWFRRSLAHFWDSVAYRIFGLAAVAPTLSLSFVLTWVRGSSQTCLIRICWVTSSRFCSVSRFCTSVGRSFKI